MTVTIGRIRGHTHIIGQAQGYIGLPLRLGMTKVKLISGQEFDAPCLETAWLFEQDDIAKMIEGQPVIHRIVYPKFPLSPMSMWVGDDFVLPPDHPDA